MAVFQALYTDDSKWKCQTQAKSSWVTQVPGLSLGALTRLWSTWYFDGKLDHCMGRAYENWRTWIFSIDQGTNEDQTKGLESSPNWRSGKQPQMTPWPCSGKCFSGHSKHLNFHWCMVRDHLIRFLTHGFWWCGDTGWFIYGYSTTGRSRCQVPQPQRKIPSSAMSIHLAAKA